jgi:hypothetical protein
MIGFSGIVWIEDTGCTIPCKIHFGLNICPFGKKTLGLKD